MAEHGIVSTHAHTTRRATPHRTADNRWTAPTPIIAPVMVWVVLTGTPIAVDANSDVAAASSAHAPSYGRSFVIFIPIVFTIRQPPHMVPAAIAKLQTKMIQ